MLKPDQQSIQNQVNSKFYDRLQAASSRKSVPVKHPVYNDIYGRYFPPKQPFQANGNVA